MGPVFAQKREKKMSEKELKVAQAVSYKMYQKDLVMYMTAVSQRSYKKKYPLGHRPDGHFMK